jgi:serine/threonine protein kinase
VLRGEEDEEAQSPPGESTPPVSVGDLLKARFRLLDLVGEGGMGRVYQALDLRRVESGSTEPHVAIKVLTLARAEPATALAALQREAQKLQLLSHPNIVRDFDCDRDGATVFMTMEYLVGHSLYQALLARAATGGPALERGRALAVIAAIGEALEFAHRRAIVHGDLKPGNVFVTDTGEIKVLDFGVARWVADPRAAGTGPRDAAAAVRIAAARGRIERRSACRAGACTAIRGAAPHADRARVSAGIIPRARASSRPVAPAVAAGDGADLCARAGPWLVRRTTLPAARVAAHGGPSARAGGADAAGRGIGAA